MITVEEIKNWIKGFEALRLKAYLDAVGIATIGYGTVYKPDGQRVKMGEEIDKAKAEYYFDWTINEIEKNIKINVRDIEKKISNYQFSALVSLVYNIGIGNFLKSEVYENLNDFSINFWKEHKSYVVYQTALAFMNHVYAYDRKKNMKIKLKGLVIRRKKEADLFVQDVININKIDIMKAKSISMIYGSRYIIPDKLITKEIQALNNNLIYE